MCFGDVEAVVNGREQTAYNFYARRIDEMFGLDNATFGTLPFIHFISLLRYLKKGN
jgi:hypothetical protein